MKSLNEIIKEGAQTKYIVSLIDAKDKEDLPITVTILVDNDNIKEFEDYLNNSEGDIFAHAEGGNVEY